MISIVLPTYNVKDYIEACVSSLVKQTYADIEILLVNDGSTDGTGELCDRLALTDARIRVFHKENGGASSARNLGIREAKGQYVMFMDPDDWLDEDTFQTLVPLIEEHNLDVIRFSYIRELEHISVVKENTFVKEGLSEAEALQKVYRQTMGLVGNELAHPENMNFLASVCFSLYKKEIIDSNGLSFFDIRKIATFSDGLFNLQFLQKSKNFYYIDRPFYHYRKFTAGAATNKYRKDFLEKQLLLFDMLYAFVEQENSPVFLEAYNNRISFSALELSLNALCANTSDALRYKEVRKILSSPQLKKALKKLQLQHFDIKWKIYFLFAKWGLSVPLFIMTKVAWAMQRRG